MLHVQNLNDSDRSRSLIGVHFGGEGEGEEREEEEIERERKRRISKERTREREKEEELNLLEFNTKSVHKIWVKKVKEWKESFVSCVSSSHCLSPPPSFYLKINSKLLSQEERERERTKEKGEKGGKGDTQSTKSVLSQVSINTLSYSHIKRWDNGPKFSNWISFLEVESFFLFFSFYVYLFLYLYHRDSMTIYLFSSMPFLSLFLCFKKWVWNRKENAWIDQEKSRLSLPTLYSPSLPTLLSISHVITLWNYLMIYFFY